MKIAFCGDPHGQFKQIHRHFAGVRPDLIVLLGDLQPERMLSEELRDMIGAGARIRFIVGNHDSDSEDDWDRVSDPAAAHLDLGWRAEEIDGIRIAGLPGVFREKAWDPTQPPPSRSSYSHYMKELERKRPYGERGKSDGKMLSQVLRHKTTIFYDDYLRLATLSADILVCHEAPSAHEYGYAAVDDLARAMGAKLLVHGHHHEEILYAPDACERMGFRAIGVGLRGIVTFDTEELL
ncbi:MAG: metallophosphoesterase [Herminiimonas sp.]|nr:metallophosphoesterase [Herminiimonas sp.]